MYYFPNLEPVHSSVSGFNCCFLTCIQIPPNAGKVVWYSQLFKNFPQFVVIHTAKGFVEISKAEFVVFLELCCFFYDLMMLAIWSLVPLPFLNPAWTFGSSWFMYCWSLPWRILSITLPSMWDECNCAVVWTFFGSFTIVLCNNNAGDDVWTRQSMEFSSPENWSG